MFSRGKSTVPKNIWEKTTIILLPLTLPIDSGGGSVYNGGLELGGKPIKIGVKEVFYMNVNLTKEEIELLITCLKMSQYEISRHHFSGPAGQVLADNSLNIHLIKTRLEWQLKHGEK